MDAASRLYSSKEVVDLIRAGRRIFGTPKAIPHPKSKMLLPLDHQKGALAENATASLINLLTVADEYQDLYTFHSVGEVEEEGTSYETDHLLLYNRSLFIIETKHRANVKKIVFHKDGHATATRQNGNVGRFPSNHLVAKVARYQQHYAHLKVEGIVVAHTDLEEYEAHVENITVTTLPGLLPLLMDKLNQVKIVPTDTVALVKEIGSRCIRNEHIA